MWGWKGAAKRKRGCQEGWEMAERLSWKTAPRVRVWMERKGYRGY